MFLRRCCLEKMKNLKLSSIAILLFFSRRLTKTNRISGQAIVSSMMDVFKQTL